MKQTAAIAFISIAIIALVGITGFLFIQDGSQREEEYPAAAGNAESWTEPAAFDGIGTIDPAQSGTMNEAQLQFFLHEMTHSKVYAEDKWGEARPISQENIDRLLGVVEASDFKDRAYYRRTLEEWEDGDFMNAVDVHNKIWHLHGGTIGKATRLMTQEEEEAYIRTRFSQ
jgi:hypothetical protein